MYAYVGHDPINLVDPMGTMATNGGFSTNTGLTGTTSPVTDFTSIGIHDPGINSLLSDQNIVLAATGTAIANVIRLGTTTFLGTTTTRSTIQFGSNANQISHAFRHIDKVGLNRADVKSAISRYIGNGAKLKNGLNKGSANVNGTRIEFSIFRLPDGTVNVGRITPPR